MQEVMRADMLSECRRQEINIFPLQPRSKVPISAWKQYQTENFMGDIPPECNFAIVCGDISKNLAVFDFDNCPDIKTLDCVLEDAVNNTLVVKTSRGFHVYLKMDKAIKNMKLTKRDMIIDVQSSGKYVVAPTSVHPSGMTYDVVSRTLDIKRVFGEEVLQRLLDAGFAPKVDESGNELTGYNIAKGGVKYGSLHNSFVKYCNFLVLVQDIRDRHTYDKMCENWNRDGNNEYVINEHDFTQVKNDCWKFSHEKLAKEEAGENVKKDGKKEKPYHYAELVAQELPFKTMADTKEILYYEDGVYLLGGERKIEEICQRIIPECQINDVREVIAEIQRSTYVDREAFDSDPYKICLTNCIVDVITGDLSEHTPDQLYRNKVPVVYDPKILPIQVPQFLRETHLEPATIMKLLEEAAYIMLREPLFQVAFMYTGIGSNGKSVWLDWLVSFFGKENCAEVSLHDLATNRFRVAELDGKLLNVYADLKSDALKQNDILKPLIGGDAITVEKKNQHPFVMEPYTKLIFSANQIPEIYDNSIGMYRRLSLTRWDVVFSEQTRDVNKFKKMNTDREKSGMLNIFMRTLKNLVQRGRFLNEMSMDDRRNTWMVQADPVIEFVNDHVVKDEKQSIPYDDLYAEFMQTIGTGDKGVLKPTFYRKVQTLTGAKRGRSRIGGMSKSMFEGITLRRLLRDAGQASFDDKPAEDDEKPDSDPSRTVQDGTAFVHMNDEKPKRKFESDDD